jgi:hypothetical protein
MGIKVARFVLILQISRINRIFVAGVALNVVRQASSALR